MRKQQVRVVVGGHAFDRAAFDAALRALPDVEVDYLKHPDAALRLNPRDLHGVDALLLYDIPGIDFRATHDAPRLFAPPAEFLVGFEALLLEGLGIVALHHALAGWPAWPAYGAVLGGCFRYRPKHAAGADLPDSGYATDVEYGVDVVDPSHPVTQGLPSRFLLRDEPYRCEVHEARVTPLLRADRRYTSAPFESAARAVGVSTSSAADSAQPPPASALVAWTREVFASRIVYLQPGDGPAAFGDPNWRRFVGNALHWVARRG
ncbi:MAG: ThuA domain-containing protein [Steroidobacteraceae bacterium]